MQHLENGNVQSLINESVAMYSRCRNVIWETLCEYRDSKPDLANLIHALVSFAGDRSQALIWLVQAGYLWDADMVMRSISEATIKVMFLCFTEDEEQWARVDEFWNDLAEVRQLKHSDRIKQVMAILDSGDPGTAWLSQQVLSEQEQQELRARWPKQKRQRLEQKWSFFEMLADIDKHFKAIGQPVVAHTAMYGYGASSHFIHADELALMLVWDREHRDPEVREKLEIAHACRLLIDHLSCPVMALQAMTHAFAIKDRRAEVLLGEVKPLFDDLHRLQDDFYRTQEELLVLLNSGENIGPRV